MTAAAALPVLFSHGAHAHAAASVTDRGAAEVADTSTLGQVAEVSLPFLRHGAVRDWRADGSKGLWVQGRDRRWYYGEFMSPCQGLRFANTIGFESTSLDRLDRWSRVRVPGGIGGACTLRSFTTNEGPPARLR